MPFEHITPDIWLICLNDSIELFPNVLGEGVSNLKKLAVMFA